MYDLISAFCAGMIPFLIANIYSSFDIIVNHELPPDDPWHKEKKRFAIAVNLVSVYMLIGCIGWLLWDGDVISKTDQYKISLVGRFFAIVGSFLLFLTFSLGISRRNKIIITACGLVMGILTYVWKVMG